MLEMTLKTPSEVRAACRSGGFHRPTPGLAPGFVQANLVVLPQDWAFEFLLFCTRNPKPCPILDVTEPGDPEPRFAAPGADLRSDLPQYRVWKDGVLVDEPFDVRKFWRDDLVAFLIGCSFSFESALQAAQVPVRHIEESRNVPMYQTNIPCRSAGRFHGPLVVSMRPLQPAHAVTATRICARYSLAHGTPVHFGSPEAIGIRDLGKPDFGEAVTVHPGEIPVFWACGVTPQAALMNAKPPFAITHRPGHMFLTDLLDSDMERA